MWFYAISILLHYRPGTYLYVKWRNGLEITGSIDTMFDTNNGLEDDEDGYKEYHACLVSIESVIANPNRLGKLYKGSLLEVSIENCPMLIKLEDGTVIWSESIMCTLGEFKLNGFMKEILYWY